MTEPTYLSVEELHRLTETAVTLPELSAAAGHPVQFLVRKISRTEYLSLFPLPPAEAAQWKPEEWDKRELAWVRGLTPEALQRRRAQLRDTLYATTALASLRPMLTLDDARRLGSDGEEAAIAILRFSGLLVESPPAASNGHDAAATDVPSAAPEAPHAELAVGAS